MGVRGLACLQALARACEHALLVYACALCSSPFVSCSLLLRLPVGALEGRMVVLTQPALHNGDGDRAFGISVSHFFVRLLPRVYDA